MSRKNAGEIQKRFRMLIQLAMPITHSLTSVLNIERQIHLIRGRKDMFDSDLAALYHVSTKAFNRAVKRNKDRVPEEFMFQLSNEEAASVRSQIATASKRNLRYRPYAFTEHGVAMLSVL